MSQVFHSLLKAHALEARNIVRQALDILTPVVPVRMEDFANVSPTDNWDSITGLPHSCLMYVRIYNMYVYLMTWIIGTLLQGYPHSCLVYMHMYICILCEIDN